MYSGDSGGGGTVPPRPKLVDPAAYRFLGGVLYQNYVYRTRWTNFAVNFLIATVAAVAIGYFAIRQYKNRPTDEEIYRREMMKKHETLAMIKKMQMEKLHESQGTITGLPNWKNEYETVMQSSAFYR